MKKLLVLAAISILAMPLTAEQSYSPYVDRDYPENVYWGDTHLHTYLSGDAYSFGATITPDEAYRFAKGKIIRTDGGEDTRIRRPLDFMMVADHANNMGVLPALVAGDPRVLATKDASELAKRLARRPTVSELLKSATEEEYGAGSKLIGAAKSVAFSDYGIEESFKRDVWQEVVAVAERHNDPGTFTTFVGYEYTPTPIHRNVLFVGGPSDTLQTIPFSSADSQNPEDLWAQLTRYKETTGSDVIAIPHNSNLSRGNTFRQVTFEGKPISRDYARIRSDIEPIIEVTQIKGDSETYPLISPNDEFADHETYRLRGPAADKESNRTTEDVARASYARSALQTGLDIEANVGLNPYKFGMIGSTDAHTGIASVDEDNFWGKLGGAEPSRFRPAKQANWASAGYAAVWATENTREAIFSALKRREVYATTGPRITLRFFASWNFSDSDALRPDIATVGYSRGVPMGGDLIQSEGKKAPTFLVRATKDPEGANLDRVQIIKGWRDASGKLEEKIYNVAWSGQRKIGTDGLLPSVGSTVNLPDASYKNTIGTSELSTTWRDPDFNQSERAVYYVRVLQIPTPRWTVYDAKFYGVNFPQTPPPVIEERAYSSPIWYTPQ